MLLFVYRASAFAYMSALVTLCFCGGGMPVMRTQVDPTDQERLWSLSIVRFVYVCERERERVISENLIVTLCLSSLSLSLSLLSYVQYVDLRIRCGLLSILLPLKTFTLIPSWNTTSLIFVQAELVPNPNVCHLHLSMIVIFLSSNVCKLKFDICNLYCSLQLNPY